MTVIRELVENENDSLEIEINGVSVSAESVSLNDLQSGQIIDAKQYGGVIEIKDTLFQKIIDEYDGKSTTEMELDRLVHTIESSSYFIRTLPN